MKRDNGIALASALGVLAGLSVAIVYRWEILPTLLSAAVCMVVAWVTYRPHEIATIVWNACRALPGAFRSMPQEFLVRKEKIQKGLGSALLVLECTALGTLSFLAIPVFLFLCGVLPAITSKNGQYIDVGSNMVTIGALFGVVGSLVFFYLLVVCHAQSPSWAFRISKAFRWIFKDEGVQRKKGISEKQEILLVCLWFPILLELISIVVIVVVLDVIATFLLALASSERIAAILCAFLGWGTGVLLHVLGVPGDLFLLALGTIVGVLSGRCLYRLREHLAAVPATATS